MGPLSISEKLYEADININAAGNNTIIVAPSGQYIAIDFLQLIPTNAVTVQFVNGATNYGGAYPLGAGQVITNENSFQNPDGVMTMGYQNAFIINLGGAVQCGGFVRYRLMGN